MKHIFNFKYFLNESSYRDTIINDFVNNMSSELDIAHQKTNIDDKHFDVYFNPTLKYNKDQIEQMVYDYTVKSKSPFLMKYAAYGDGYWQYRFDGAEKVNRGFNY